MMTIARVTHRHYNTKDKKPWDCADHTVNYYTDIEKARAAVKDFLGAEATVDNDFGFDIWVSPNLPQTEYIIDLINVY